MRGKGEQKMRVGWESANKKSSANKFAKSYASSKSQKTAPQPTRHFCSAFPALDIVRALGRLRVDYLCWVDVKE